LPAVIKRNHLAAKIIPSLAGLVLDPRLLRPLRRGVLLSVRSLVAEFIRAVTSVISTS